MRAEVCLILREIMIRSCYCFAVIHHVTNRKLLAFNMKLQDVIPGDSSVGCRIQIRYILAALSFLGVVLSTAAKSFMGAAIVAMVKRGQGSSRNESISTEGTCPSSGTESDHQTESGEFAWSEVLQGYVLSSYFYGYLCTQLLGGYLSDRFGPRFVTGFCNILTGVSTLVAPLAVRSHVYYFIAARAVAGLSSGAVVPSIMAVFPKWFHLDEQHMMAGFVYLGLYFGSFIGLGLTGILLNGGRWAIPFYFWGGSLILWSGVWIFFAFNTPKEHPMISTMELNYIESSPKYTKEANTKQFTVPWCSIFTSLPVWAWIGYQVGTMWVVYIIVTELPSYLHNIQRFNAQMSGVITSLSGLIGGTGGLVFTAVAQWIRKRNILSRLNIYRLFNGIVSGGILVCFISITLLGCDPTGIIVSVIVISITNSSSVGGSSVINNIDLAPNFAGVLIGMQFTMSHATGIFVPLVVGYLIQNNQTFTQWNKVFYIGAGLNVLMYFFYVCFGSADEQPWNEMGKKTTLENESSANKCEAHK